MGRRRHSALTFLLGSLLAIPMLGTSSATAQTNAQKKARYCGQLEGQLALLQRSDGSRNARSFAKLDAAVHKQQAQIDVAKLTAKRDGCLGGGFLFRKQPKATCPALLKRIDKMQRNLGRLQKKRSRFDAPGKTENKTLAIVQKLANAGCGQQYANYNNQRSTQRPNGLFGVLFGQPSFQQNGYDVPKISTYRTVCVRTCDGYFFPVSFATTRGNFSRDAGICQANCPGTDTRLYIYSNPGESPDDMRTPQGDPYRNLETAFKYRTEYVEGCSCKRPQSQLTSITKSDQSQSQRLPELKSSQPISPVRTGPLVPIPMPQPDRSLDPDTQQAQLQGIPFNPYKPPKVSSDKNLVQAADGRSIRIVGPKFFGTQE